MKRYLRGKKKVKVELEVKDNDQVFATIVCKAKDSEPIAKKLTEEAELLVERRRIHEQNVRLHFFFKLENEIEIRCKATLFVSNILKYH